ncbi:MAG: hypothetical protein J5983_01675 [Ruminococcus sp.]|nr:hypothetical protein [Ruminococcus sp.]
MKDLTFGEQVKIILSRKGMTIKELAELIQEETGKAMSRQNLTQRLGRDNFQEQDMRMIASILGCPFRLSIFPLEGDDAQEFNIDEETIERYMKKSEKKRKKVQADAEDEGVYQQEFVFDETMTASVAEEPEKVEVPAAEEPEAVVEEVAAEESEAVVEEITAEEPEVIVEEAASEVPAEEEPVEAVVEEPVYEAAEELVYEVAEEPVYEAVEEPVYEAVEEPVYEAAEEPVYEAAEEPVYEAVEEPVYEAAEELVYEAAEEPVYEDAQEPVYESAEDMTIGEFYEMSEAQNQAQEEAAAPAEEPKKHRTGGMFLRRFGFGQSDKHKKSSGKAKVEVKEEPKPAAPAPVAEPEPMYIPDPEEFEPVIRHQDEAEDLSLGEMNPYTGHEYMSNSVRMHPSRIGYVQVYDRAKHGWVDMTEWAFLGYQERKKAALGRDYEPPIYLD